MYTALLFEGLLLLNIHDPGEDTQSYCPFCSKWFETYNTCICYDPQNPLVRLTTMHSLAETSLKLLSPLGTNHAVYQPFSCPFDHSIGR